MASCCENNCAIEKLHERQRGTLKAVLVINAVMFVVIVGGAVYGKSTALLSDSLDNLGDALTYGLSLYAVSKEAATKAKVALFKALLALIVEIERSLFWLGLSRQGGSGMNTKSYRDWLKGLDELTSHQQQRVLSRLNKMVSGDTVAARLEQAAPQGCPQCQSHRLARWGRQAGLQRYRCRDCGKCCNALTGTPLARLRHKDCWLTYSQAMIEGLTVRNAAYRCGIDKTTSFRWRHRFLTDVVELKATGLTGIVEADETYFPLSFKGSRHLPRPAHHRGHDIHQRGTGEDQVPVLVLRDRHGATTDFKLTLACQREEAPILSQVIRPDSILCTDGGASLKGAARQAGIAHRALNLSAGVRVLAGVYHIQNVNAYDSRLKNWMRQFHGVATKYLENYLGWRRGLEQWGELATPQTWMLAAVGQINC